MEDLKLIDELVCRIKQREKLSFKDLEFSDYLMMEVFQRLRKYYNKEKGMITLSLANYFESKE